VGVGQKHPWQATVKFALKVQSECKSTTTWEVISVATDGFSVLLSFDAQALF